MGDGAVDGGADLYVILYGFLILRGSVQEPIMEFAFRAIKLAIILMLVRNAGEYQTYVTNIFFETLPREVSEALNTGGAKRNDLRQPARQGSEVRQ